MDRCLVFTSPCVVEVEGEAMKVKKSCRSSILRNDGPEVGQFIELTPNITHGQNVSIIMINGKSN